MGLVTPLAFTVAVVLKEPYFLLYQDKLNITGYHLFLSFIWELGQASRPPVLSSGTTVI